MVMVDSHLERLFANAYVLGGSPCSGKSSAAERLAVEFDWPYYKVDDHEREHSERISPERHPVRLDGDDSGSRH